MDSEKPRRGRPAKVTDIPANFVPHKSGDQYDTEEERRFGYLISTRNYSAIPWTCGVCNVTIRTGNRSNHLKSVKHIRNLGKLNNNNLL